MAGKIFFRERLKTGKGEKKPRYRLIATAGVDIEFYSDHLRKKELEEIAGVAGAELVLLKSSADGGREDEDTVQVK